VRFYGEALRGVAGPRGVRVNVICPGWITTPLTDKNDFPMPFIMTPERAAERIACGLRANKARIAFPRRLYFPLRVLSILPDFCSDAIFGAIQGNRQNP
jgi:short-subunit dehydrogenase